MSDRDFRAQIDRAMAQLTAARDVEMVDTCTVTRPGELEQTPTLDADGNTTGPTAPTVYDGRCTIADPEPAQLRGRSTNEQAAVAELRQLRVPSDVDLHTGDEVVLTASAYSPGLVGDRFLVVREDERSFATYRRYIIRGSTWLSPPVGP